MSLSKRAVGAEDLSRTGRVVARRAVQALVPLLGRRAHDRRALPGILLVGAQRAGTTALHRSLAAHPAIKTPISKKGVHYFDVSYTKGLGWYLANFPIATPGTQAMETSPYYLFHPAVPARVANDLPDARIVVLVRDPVERTASHHHHEKARGYETLDLEAALDAEEERLSGAEDRLLADPFAVDLHHLHHAYLARSRYAEQLTRWHAKVRSSQVLVLDAHPLFAGSHDAMRELASFLDIDIAGLPPLRRVNGYQRSELAPSVRHRLERYFEPHNKQLSGMLGRTLSWQ